MNKCVILTCGEDIAFDGSPEIWPIFCMELGSILMNHGTLMVISTTSGAGVGETLTKLFFRLIWLGRVMQLPVNNTILRWPMGKGGDDGISIWGWMKVRYDSVVKLQPLYKLYMEKIISLRLKSNGLLVIIIEQFQGLEILQQQIYRNSEPKYQLIIQMVEDI